MTAEHPIRVLLVDDSAVVRIGLKEVLSADPMIEVIGEASTSDEGMARATELQPDVVLLDVRLPEAGGIETCRQLLEAMPGVRVLFLSAFADDELVRTGILVGAHGYLLKEIDAALLVESIKRVASGESILDPALRRDMLSWVLRNVPAGTADQVADAALSPQEERIVALVADGKTNKEIALILELSPKTVKNYLHNVFEKLGSAAAPRPPSSTPAGSWAGASSRGNSGAPGPGPLAEGVAGREPRAVGRGQRLEGPATSAAPSASMVRSGPPRNGGIADAEDGADVAVARLRGPRPRPGPGPLR